MVDRETELGEPEAGGAGDDSASADRSGAEGTGEDQGIHTALPPRVESWRRRSAVGAILTGFAFGLQEALEPRRDDPSVVMETSGIPPTDLPVEAELEQIRPRQSVVKIRPWLLPASSPAATVDPPRASPSTPHPGTQPPKRGS